MSATEAAILRRAKARIEDPERWTQQAYARNATGGIVKVISADAVCWCAIGALFAEEDPYDLSYSSERRLISAAHHLGRKSILDVNENTDHATVMQMFDLAIELAEGSDSMADTALPHTEITKALARIIVNANELDPAYRWGHNLGFSKRRSGPMEGTTSGRADPTKDVVTSVELHYQRLLVAKASTRIMAAAKELELAISAVAAAYRAANEEHRISAEPLIGEQIRKAELAVAQRAQGRRLAREEGWGEG